MSRRLHHQMTYDAPLAAVVEMLADPRFREAVCEYQRVLRSDVEIDRSGDAMTVIIEQVSETELRVRRAREVPEDEYRFAEESPIVLSDRAVRGLAEIRRARRAHLQEHATGRPLGWVRAEALLTWMGIESGSTHAHRAISEKVVTIAPDAPLREAITALSRHEVTHLLVCREGDVAGEGVVTALDLVAAWDG